MILRLLGCILTAEILEYPQDANHHPSGNVGTSVIGLIVALSCNLAFLKAILGFFLGAIFFAASIVCQAVFVNKAFFSVEDAGLDDSTLSGLQEKRDRPCREIRRIDSILPWLYPSHGFGRCWYGACLRKSADFGCCGRRCISAGLFSRAVFSECVSFKKGVYDLSEKEAAIYHRNHKLKRNCAIALVIVLAVTFVGHQFSTSIWGPYSIMESTATFEDYDSFIQYMQQDISAASGYHTEEPDAVAIRIPYGTEDAPTRRLEAKNGNVVCEYIDRNETVVSLRSTPKDRTLLPITVCTEDDLRAAQQTAAVRHVIFCAAYCLECLVIAAVYIRKKAK